MVNHRTLSSSLLSIRSSPGSASAKHPIINVDGNGHGWDEWYLSLIHI